MTSQLPDISERPTPSPTPSTPPSTQPENQGQPSSERPPVQPPSDDIRTRPPESTLPPQSETITKQATATVRAPEPPRVTFSNDLIEQNRFRRMFTSKQKLGPQRTNPLPRVDATPAPAEPPTPEFIWGYENLPRENWPGKRYMPQWMTSVNYRQNLKDASEAMGACAAALATNQHYQVYPKTVASHFPILRTRFTDDGLQEIQSSDVNKKFKTRQTLPYYAALFASRHDREDGAWHWWAIASIREPHPQDTTVPDPGVPQHLLVYDSLPLPKIERWERDRKIGLRNFLRKDQCHMLEEIHREVPIQHIFLNTRRLTADVDDPLMETLWWIWNVANRGDVPCEMGTELDDIRMRVVEAITLKFAVREGEQGRDRHRKLILQTIRRRPWNGKEEASAS
ncbi:uncharacterized protein BP01DRAFT_378202 [Aspergillus saccharolyticus JOP 1030-1]|uniref:Uncharacterized protein n=1 Tax=Aspergillus saccharolyticus JOP 1030-1 TaxID=1450539 RepID=A0A318ZPR5_9EURO|nr:hypothetical protein BP01DRAFT_378202 [Aspergillus saccharolyticus JOP 1030-1]PYH49589.1 hypothetical protein BP01DRAFT_378202 [Aspergillus saccharolyticus JOP 1030-1]